MKQAAKLESQPDDMRGEEEEREARRASEMCSVARSVYQRVVKVFQGIKGAERVLISGYFVSPPCAHAIFFTTYNIDFCVCAHESINPSPSLLLSLAVFFLPGCV